MIYLSKSKYCGLWQCPKIAWMKKYKPEELNLDGSVVSRMEAAKLKKIVSEVDPHAFVTVCDVHEALGEGFTYQHTEK